MNKIRKNHLLYLTVFLYFFLFTNSAYASVYVPTNFYFGYANGCYINFNTPKTFNTVYRENGFWYFDGYGFNVRDANLTISKFFQDNQLVFTVSASTGTTSTTRIYTADKGKPSKIIGNIESWSYDYAVKILTINVQHHSSEEIIIEWKPLFNIWEISKEMLRQLIPVIIMLAMLSAAFAMFRKLS